MILTVDVGLHVGGDMILLSGDVFATSRAVLPVEVIREQYILSLRDCGVELNPLEGVSFYLSSI